MIIVSVTYPATEGSRFDLEHYREKHMPLVQTHWGPCGLTDAKYMRGVGALGSGAIAYHLTALLSFESADAFQRAAEQHGREIMSDIKNFTDVTPVVQINEPVA